MQKGGKGMIKILNFVALVVENFAILGAGFMSAGLSYQPEIPEELNM